MKKSAKTFEAQDVNARQRAQAASNMGLDLDNETQAQPEAGTNKRQKGSARSAAGEGIPSKKASGKKLSGVAARALAFTESPLH